MPSPDRIGLPRLYLEERVRDAVMDDPDLFRRQVQNAYCVAARGFGHGDQGVGAFENPLGKALVGGHIRRRMGLRQQPAGKIVHGGGEFSAPRRI